MRTATFKMQNDLKYKNLLLTLDELSILHAIGVDNIDGKDIINYEITIIDEDKDIVKSILKYKSLPTYVTDYKNFPITILLSIISGLFTFSLLYLFSLTDLNIGKYLAMITGILIFFLIGRIIIIRHTIIKNQKIIIEYKLRPNYKQIIKFEDINDIYIN